ncbi:hypothetical protein GCM10023189_41410 [Nibrella saemangeumensis]|uniref:NAD-dependent epimerase/dehydratase domain-containing protein n=2 Tax=Nibrella saemangeumensis TaxID=1084526 RepID=A0ABP8NDC2_9BACT
MIARHFQEYAERDDVLIFASGVSNSKETRPEPFLREWNLMQEWVAQAGDRLFVYFSTCSVADPTEENAPYVQHKLAVEEFIATHTKHYLIIRASNVVGGAGNPHTILNYFLNRVTSGEPFDIWQGATRNLIDIDDMYRVVTYFMEQKDRWNRILNVANPYSVSPLQIVRAVETHTRRQGNYRLIAKGSPFAIDTSDCAAILADRQHDLRPEQYLHYLLQKYY